MGKLRGHTVYVSGSIERAIDGGVGWRRQIKPRLQAMGIGVIDPTDKPDGSNVDEAEMRNIANKAKAEGDYNKVRDMYKKIVHEDLRYTDLASFLIVNVDMDNHLCGSIDEAFMAANQQKPVIIVCEKGMEHIPNWMYGRLQHELFFTSFDDMFAYLERLDAGLEPDLDRWVFIDYKKVFGQQVDD